MKINVAARASNLSKVQFQEVVDLLAMHHPHVELVPTFVETRGDLDKTSSLRTLDKTDFFTREIDAMVRDQVYRLAIHSAKDLPNPLPSYLQIVALTKGIDASDSLVVRQGESLPMGGVVATSSLRREQNVRAWRADVTCVDIRGTIEERLHQLDEGHVDGVVIAEAALIRLKLNHRTRIKLEGETTPHQGRLAVVAHATDGEMTELLGVLGEVVA